MTFAFAHRGNSANFDENTMESLQSAFGLGANGIEFDIQRTSDGELILMHDATVNRTTNGTGTVTALTWSYISGLQTTSGYSVPRLVDVFDAFYGKSIWLLLEIKFTEDLAADIRALANNYPSIDSQLQLYSFDLSTAVSCKAEFPLSRTGPAYGNTNLDNTLSVVTSNNFNIWPCRYDLMIAQDVTDAHAAGVQIYGFTLPTRVAGEQAFNEGYDGVGMDDTNDLLLAASDAGVTLTPPPTLRSAQLKSATGADINSNFSSNTVRFYENGTWGTLAIS